MSKIRVKYFFLLLALICLVLFLKEIDFALCREQLERIGWGIFPIIGVSFIAYVLASAAWQLCYYGKFSNEIFGSLKSWFNIRQIGESLATINPTGVVGGDALKYVLLRKEGFDKEAALVSLSVFRVLSIFSFVVLLMLWILVLSLGTLDQIEMHWMVLILLTLTAFTYVLYRLLFSSKLWLYRITSKFMRFPNSEKTLRFVQKVESFNKSTSQARSLSMTILLSAFSLLLLHWLFGALEFMLILHYLGYDISLYNAFVLEIGTSFVRSIMSFIPGQIGVEEYSNKMFLELIGVQDKGVWISVSIVRRIRQLFWIITGLYLYLRYYNYKVREIEESEFMSGGQLATH